MIFNKILRLNKTTKNLVKTGFLIFGLTTFTSCQKTEPLKNKVALKVNNAVITIGEFSKLLAKELKNNEVEFVKDKQFIERAKKDIIRRITLRKITEQWAGKNKIQVTSQEVKGEINKIRSQYPNDIEFRNVLAKQKVHLKKWKQDIRYSILQKKVFEKLKNKLSPISQKELKLYYEKNNSKFLQPEKILLRQIVLEKRGVAEQVYKRLKSRRIRAKFEDLAKKYSVAPEAKNEGLVGWIHRSTLDIFDKAFKLPINKISQIYKSPYGFHIFRVEKKRKSSYIPYEKAKASLKRELLAKREQAYYLTWLEKQIQQSKIYKNNSLISRLKIKLKDERQ